MYISKGKTKYLLRNESFYLHNRFVLQNLNLQEKIICHINYRDVFNAPVLKTSLMTWLGVGDLKGNYEFDNIIDELKSDRLIIEKDGYFAVFGKENIIDDQPRKTALTKQLLQKGSKGIKLLSSLPFVKYVGVSGSLAADNPTQEFNDEHIDLDLFIITSENTLYLFVFLERIFSNIERAIYKKHFYCCNYILDQSFLDIHNRNLYTATELINMKTISNRSNMHEAFIKNNLWYSNYYYREGSNRTIVNEKRNFVKNWFLAPFNTLLKFLFIVARTIKRLDFTAIKEINTRFNPAVRFNMKRVCTPNGGYQHLIMERFKDKLIKNFPKYNSHKLIENCFPLESKLEFQPQTSEYDNDVNQLFRKYSLKNK